MLYNLNTYLEETSFSSSGKEFFRKMKKGFFLSTIAILSLGALSGCGGARDGEVKIWCDQKVIDTAKAQVEAFKAAHPEYEFSYKIEPQSESSAAGNMITDPKAGADIYFFAQDQLSRLITAKAISALGEAAANKVKAENDAGSVGAATVNDKVYAYPATSDNTYFLYYDKEVISAEQAKNLGSIVAAAKEAGKKVYFETGSAWYNASFFYGAGAHSEWTTDAKGNFTAKDDNYNSAAGLIAMKGMASLAKESAVHVNSSENGAFENNAAALVSGTWAKSDVEKTLGDNMGVTVLPKYTVDNKDYQLTSFGGFKLVGTKPQTTEIRASLVSDLALALTSESAQLARFEQLGWGPSNKNAQANEKVQADPTLQAVFAQNEFSTPQGQYPGKWWDHAGALGKGLDTATNYAEMLESYEAGLEDFID